MMCPGVTLCFLSHFLPASLSPSPSLPLSLFSSLSFSIFLPLIHSFPIVLILVSIRRRVVGYLGNSARAHTCTRRRLHRYAHTWMFSHAQNSLPPFLTVSVVPDTLDAHTNVCKPAHTRTHTWNLRRRDTWAESATKSGRRTSRASSASFRTGLWARRAIRVSRQS